MIYTVTTNPNIDYYVTLGAPLTVGAINRAASEVCCAGGKGINVSIMLARLGVANRALGFTAGHVGQMLEHMLAQEGCVCDFVRLSCGETRINVKLTGACETAINGKGPTPAPHDADALLGRLDALTAADTLVLSGNVQSGAADLFERLMQRASDAGAALVVDTEGAALTSALRYRPLLVKPNREELASLCGKPLDTLDAVQQAARELQRCGAENVLVSMGADGALLLGSDGICRRARTTAQGSVRSTVGAGDSMVAGFLAGLSGGLDEALRLGSAAGTATAFAPVLAAQAEVLQLCACVCIERL